METPTSDSLLTTEEVAEQLQVPRRTVLRYVQEGRLKCRKYSQRTFRFSPGDVEEFIRKSEGGES